MKQFFIDIFRVWRNEFRVVRTDIGVLIFFFLLPLTYPLVYSAIYNPEVARDVAVVVVDDSRTPLTREYARHLEASPDMKIVGYAANMQEAHRAMAEKECYAVIHFPKDFSQCVGRGEIATLEIFCDMSLLLRYRSILLATTAVANEMGTKVQVERLAELSGASTTSDNNKPIPFKLEPIGNVSQGLASAIMPGVLVLIIQQCIVLAICFLGATSRERRKVSVLGIDTMEIIGVGATQKIIGKALCYFILISIPSIVVLHFVPIIFTFPMNANVLDLITFFTPYLFAVIFFGMVIQHFLPDRESTFLMFVFTSIAFIFLSGISWPRYAMSDFWQILGDCIPSTWGVNGFVEMNTAGATLAQQSSSYIALCVMCIAYFIIAVLMEHISQHKKHIR